MHLCQYILKSYLFNRIRQLEAFLTQKIIAKSFFEFTNERLGDRKLYIFILKLGQSVKSSKGLFRKFKTFFLV
jgi:hypothetical protein